MKKYIIAIILAITCIILFFVVQQSKMQTFNAYDNQTELNITLTKALGEEYEEENVQKETTKTIQKTEEKIETTVGILKIPKIGLNSEVHEDTTNETIDKHIGHFKNTSIWFGNVAVCAHNRGFVKNYFHKLNELKIGDIVTYSTVYATRNYTVSHIQEIAEDEISVLEDSKENKLTMITCITNKPNKRLCVQAIEKE